GQFRQGGDRDRDRRSRAQPGDRNHGRRRGNRRSAPAPAFGRLPIRAGLFAEPAASGGGSVIRTGEAIERGREGGLGLILPPISIRPAPEVRKWHKAEVPNSHGDVRL